MKPDQRNATTTCVVWREEDILNSGVPQRVYLSKLLLLASAPIIQIDLILGLDRNIKEEATRASRLQTTPWEIPPFPLANRKILICSIK
jgi:hypothetical protein